jgi:hypothetical protein
MRISHFIIISVAALVGVFAVGCSKSTPNPIVSFQGYKVGTDGRTQAIFEFKNPSQSLIVCQVQIQPGDRGTESIIYIQPGGSLTDTLFVRQTNSVSLSVTVMRVVPVRQFSVPMP